MKHYQIPVKKKRKPLASMKNILLASCTALLALPVQAQLSYVTLPPLTTNNYDYGDVTVPGGKSLTITASNARFGTITVKPEAQLIIKNTTVLMRNKIIVQCGPECDYPKLMSEPQANKPTYYCQGGELLVQSSTLTSLGTLGYKKWSGIEVWGPDNIQAVQTETKGHVFFTSSTVSNAKVAVSTCRADFQKKGGLIRATDTRFTNNDMGVQYYGTPSAPNSYYNPPFYVMELAVNGLQYFLRCSFDYTSTYTAPGAEGTYGNTHIRLFEGCKDIRILGCTFDDHFGTKRNCTGVQVNGADFVVDNKYTVSPVFLGGGTQTSPSTFNNLWYGVNVYQYADADRSIVMNSSFTNTDHAINVNSAFKPVLTGNKIAIPQNNGWQEQQYTFGNGLYYISEGIHLTDCSNYSVQNNTMTANTNYSATRTIGIYVYNSGPQPNKINSNAVSNANFNYYANGSNFQYAPLSGSKIGLRFICNTNAGAKGNDFTVMGGYSAGIAGVQNSVGLYQSAANTFAPKGPGGFYSFFMETGCNPVRYYGYGTTKNLNNYSHTPNVTPANLLEYPCPAITMGPKFPLPAQWEVKLSTLESAIATINALPMPDSAQADTLKGYYDSYADLRDSVLDHYLYDDTSTIHYDSLAYALENMNLHHDYKLWLAGVYQTMLRYDEAIELLSSLPSQFTMSVEEEESVHKLQAMYQLLRKLNENNYDAGVLSEDDIFAIQDAYYYDGYIAHGIAAGLLNRFQDVNTFDPVPDPGTEQDESIIALKKNFGATMAKELLLYPVPAKALVTVQWKPTTDIGAAVLYVTDLTGRTLMSQPVQPGIQSVSLSGILPGIYIVTVKTAAGTVVAKEKLVKQ